MNFIRDAKKVTEFKQLYLPQYLEMINSPMGQALLLALHSLRPMALPFDVEHKDIFQYGRIAEHDLTMDHLTKLLTAPLTSEIDEIPQNYPGDEEATVDNNS